MPEVWPRQRTVEPPSFDELLNLLQHRHAEYLIYRGQRRVGWTLVCTLSRALRDQAKAGGPFPHDLIESMVPHDHDGFTAHVREIEDRFLRVFMEQATGLEVPGLPGRTDRLGWWELMQHHGVPTRLMDWTRSPLIGLWFAFWEHQDEDGDAALWIFDTRDSWINHAKALQSLGSTSWEEFLDNRQWQNRLAEELVGNPRSVVPLIVEPRTAVPRVVAQQSVLALVPNVDAPAGMQNQVFDLFCTKVRIPVDWKRDAQQFFKRNGLSRARLFRDLDSIGGELAVALRTNEPVTPSAAALHEYEMGIRKLGELQANPPS